MMPLAPTPIVPVPSKPKIGFSIDSIVGGGGGGGAQRLNHSSSNRSSSSNSNDEDGSTTRLVDIERDEHSPQPTQARDAHAEHVLEGSSSPRSRLQRLGSATSAGARSPGAHSEESDRPHSRSSSVESYPNSRHHAAAAAAAGHHHPHQHQPHHHHQQQQHHHHHHHHSQQQQQQQHRLSQQQSRPSGQLQDYSARSLAASTNCRAGSNHSGASTPNCSPSPPPTAHRLSAGGQSRNSESPVLPPASAASHPQPPPGVVRPSPNYLGPPPGAAAAAAVAAEQLKTLYGLPGAAHAASGPQAQSEAYHSQHLALAANLAAAQHFQAANLAVALQAHHGPPYPHAGPGGPGGPHPPPHPHPHQPPRDSYPLYPWLLSRHGRIFPQRFPGGPEIPGFLLQPFRKPKRIRTAFSPSQLLKLEHAFEKNHYVIGAERKQLAQALSLSETQVKVWFQNRRTKHKRMQQEEEAKAQQQSGGGGNNSSGGGNSNNSGGGANNNGNKNTHHVSKWQQETADYHDDEDEHIDPEADDCSSGSEA